MQPVIPLVFPRSRFVVRSGLQQLLKEPVNQECEDHKRQPDCHEDEINDVPWAHGAQSYGSRSGPFLGQAPKVCNRSKADTGPLAAGMGGKLTLAQGDVSSCHSIASFDASKQSTQTHS